MDQTVFQDPLCPSFPADNRNNFLPPSSHLNRPVRHNRASAMYMDCKDMSGWLAYKYPHQGCRDRAPPAARSVPGRHRSRELAVTAAAIGYVSRRYHGQLPVLILSLEIPVRRSPWRGRLFATKGLRDEHLPETEQSNTVDGCRPYKARCDHKFFHEYPATLRGANFESAGDFQIAKP